MARPLKQGVDYFPMDVHLDNKFKFLEIKFGLEGFAIAVKLLQYIYANGYWASWDEDSMLIFADEKKIDPDRLYAIVNECINRKIFSQRMYEDYKILTSSGIQKRYKEMVRRRKDVNVISEYLLIDNIYLVNDDKNPVNDDSVLPSGQHDDDKSTQRKGNKTKLNKTKTINTSDTFAAYTSNIDLIDTLNSFIEFRASIKKPMKTDRAITMLLKELDKVATTDEEKIAVLDQSIYEGWQGVFPLKQSNGSSTSGRTGQAARQKPTDPDIAYRRMEIARNQWIEAGNDPSEFVYRPN